MNFDLSSGHMVEIGAAILLGVLGNLLTSPARRALAALWRGRAAAWRVIVELNLENATWAKERPSAILAAMISQTMLILLGVGLISIVFMDLIGSKLLGKPPLEWLRFVPPATVAYVMAAGFSVLSLKILLENPEAHLDFWKRRYDRLPKDRSGGSLEKGAEKKSA